MTIRVRYDHWYPKLIKVGAITLYPFILISGTKEEAIRDQILNHEWIHVNQVRSLGWLRFYGSYLWKYFKNYLKSRDQFIAYMNISYEQEAYAGQDSFELPEEARKAGGYEPS